MVQKVSRMALVRPAQRMIVLAAWPVYGDAGITAAHLAVPVVALLATSDAHGQVEHVPVFVDDGSVMDLNYARSVHWPPHTAWRVVCCTWKKHQDDAELGSVLQVLQDTAIRDAEAARRSSSN